MYCFKKNFKAAHVHIKSYALLLLFDCISFILNKILMNLLPSDGLR